MRETKREEIDGTIYELGHLSPGEAIKVLTRITKIIGKSIDKDSLGDATNIIGSDASGIIGKLVEQLDEELTLTTIKQLLSQVRICEGEKTILVSNVFEVHFAGRIYHMLKVVTASFKHNYSDFLAGLTSAMANQKVQEMLGKKVDLK